MNETNDLASVNHSLTVERGVPDESPYYDPDDPKDAPHGSHSWEVQHRWLECSRCGARDHWPAAESRCKVPSGKGSIIGLGEALDVLQADLRAFARWWAAGDHPPKLPSVDEWAANFHEWRIGR